MTKKADHVEPGLSYERQTLHKRKIAGRTVHVISRTAYRKLTRNRFIAKCSNWAVAIRRNTIKLVNRRKVN